MGFELEEYLNQLLKIPKIARMLSLKMFLGVEQYRDQNTSMDKSMEWNSGSNSYVPPQSLQNLSQVDPYQFSASDQARADMSLVKKMVKN